MNFEIDHDAEDDARAQRQSARKIADKIEAGETLSKFEGKWIAAVIRGAVDYIQAPTRQGPPSKLPNGDDAAIEFALLVIHQGKSKTQARADLAEKYCVSIEAVRKYLDKNKRGQRALEFVSNQS